MSPQHSGGAVRDRLTAASGSYYLPGVAALVRLVLEQRRRDAAAGLATKSLVTGYPGSPLASYDLQLQREQALLDELGILHVPAAAEERAVAALMGSQMLDGFPHPDCDGVVGFWYGKGPGVDRSGDALKHANFAGTSEHGAVVVLSGEDHEASSSTMPFQEDYAFASAGIPVLYPSSVAEFTTLGLHAVALSRYSGCWVALKVVSQLCDGGQTCQLSGEEPAITIPALDIAGEPFRKRTDFTFFPGRNIDVERHLYRERHAAVAAYAQANGLDTVVGRGEGDRLGIIASGKSYADLREALGKAGLGSDDAVRASAVRILKTALVYPLVAPTVVEFARGLEQVIVIEEKRDFLEQQVKAALLDGGVAVRVLGKNDAQGRPLLPVEGAMDADLLLERLGTHLAGYLDEPGALQRRLDRIAAVRARAYGQPVSRTPNYCSGCPHNLSTRLPQGAIAWGSPGCHSFATVMEQPERHIEAMTHLGGEGLPWIGLAPFTEQRHMFHNVGDGSLWHSAYDNIRACVAAGVNITFKVLYNGAVANTGAQSAPGARSVAELTRLLELEGVSEVALVTKEPGRYRRPRLGAGTKVYPLSEILTVQQHLQGVAGVTVMIYDESCANERRRQQKRGRVERPDRYVLINERVCENCGDCGRRSNCMSLQKTATPLGSKTQVHASSCNQDYTCLEGDCPSFAMVRVKKGTGYARRSPAPLGAGELSEPAGRVAPKGPYGVYAPGVGGTGVITLNAILAVAASLDGLAVATYDQTGAAQKWGPVLSSLVVAPPGTPIWSNKIGLGEADLCLALDVVAAAAPKNLDRCDPQRTAAVVNTSLFPTGEMVRDVWSQVDASAVAGLIGQYVRAEPSVAVPAREIAETLFGDYMMTNMVALGAAYQAGLVPISAASIEQAIALNGVAVGGNQQAFRYGRLWVADPDRLRAAMAPAGAAGTDPDAYRRQALRGLGPRQRGALAQLSAGVSGLDPHAVQLLELRVADLADYHSVDYARGYVEFVLEVAAREQRVLPGATAVTHAVIEGLYKLMAYKDEYEVARLYLQPYWREQVSATFQAPVRVSYQLHPPLLRALGVQGKLDLGPWFTPAFHALRRLRRLRGTALDPFGRAEVRRVERGLPDWYRGIVGQALDLLTAGNHATAVAVAALPDRIRGYEELKLTRVGQARQEAERLLDSMRRRTLPLARVGS